MTTTAQASAAPGEITLGGTKCLMSPLTDQDWGIFERWVQDRYMDVAKRNLEGLSKDQQGDLLRHALERAATLTVSSVESLRLMCTLEGAIKQLWLGLRHNHPELTESKILEKLVDAKTRAPNQNDLDQLMGRFEEINDLTEDPSKKNGVTTPEPPETEPTNSP